MCGIVGIISNDPSKKINIINTMTDCLAHRGPDDSGSWGEENISLGHTRLAIVDLSSAGSQPMISHCGRFVLVFNGEIYNSIEIKNKLNNLNINIDWKGHSDTEIFLSSIQHFGLHKTLKLSRGMFAFGLWDRKEKQLYLVRDRIGEKPIYYGVLDNVLVFASELKALRSMPFGSFEINAHALSLMIRHGYVPAPHSIYKNIFKLLPGKIIKFSSANFEGEQETWWNIADTKKEISKNRIDISDIEAIGSLDKNLRLSIKEQMIADVKVGSMLSGGIDSTLITAIMQQENSNPINTFTIGFNNSDYDEAKYAKYISKHLGTNHTELYINAKDARNVIPMLPNIYDEPFSDSSQIPTFLVSKMTRENVTVSLSGDGGDELFGGYNRYLWLTSIWKNLGWMPIHLRKLIASIILSLPPNQVNNFFKMFNYFIPEKLRLNNYGEKFHKFGDIINFTSQESLYINTVSQWHGMLPIISDSLKYNTIDISKFKLDKNLFAEEMMQNDIKNYLPDDILVKVDRAAMSNSLETRLPFLDKRVIDFSLKIPFNMKIRNGESKWLLKQVLYKSVPKSLVDRPKQGFAIPIGDWLRGPLRDWAENLLSKDNLELDGILDSVQIREVWNKHLHGRNMQYALWNILMYQSWRLRWH